MTKATDLGSPLPSVEWNFMNVPLAEEWPCLIWEYGRFSRRTLASLPDYKSMSSVRKMVPKLAGGSISPAAFCLHRMLCTLSIFERVHKPMLAVGEEDHHSPASPSEVIAKGQMLERLSEHRLHEGLENRIDDLCEQLPFLQFKEFFHQLEEVGPSGFQKVVKEYEKITFQRFTISFPEVAWLDLDDRSRRVLYHALLSDEFVLDMDGWQQLVDGVGWETVGVPADVLRKYQFLKSAPIAENRRTNFQIDWLRSDKELLESFAEWIATRPVEFARFAKLQRSESRGPHGLELQGLRASERVSPRRALNALGVLRRWKQIEESDPRATFKKYIGLYEKALKGEAKRFESRRVYLDTERKLARALLSEMFVFPAL